MIVLKKKIGEPDKKDIIRRTTIQKETVLQNPLLTLLMVRFKTTK